MHIMKAHCSIHHIDSKVLQKFILLCLKIWKLSMIVCQAIMCTGWIAATNNVNECMMHVCVELGHNNDLVYQYLCNEDDIYDRRRKTDAGMWRNGSM